MESTMETITEPQQVNAYVLLADGRTARRNTQGAWTVYSPKINPLYQAAYPDITDPSLVLSWEKIAPRVERVIWDGEV